MQKWVMIGLFLTLVANSYGQYSFTISGSVTQASNGLPLPLATIYLKGSHYRCISQSNGQFQMITTAWFDSLQIQSVGYKTRTVAIKKGHSTDLQISLQPSENNLSDITVGASNGSGKALIEKVIEHKRDNDPMRFHSYSYERYQKNELDIDQIDFSKSNGKGMKSILLKTFSGIDSDAIQQRELPIYLTETLAKHYHSTSPFVEKDNLIAKKTLGLKTDKLLSKFDKFYFQFNVYNDWLPIFDQSYVSPLNTAANNYYKFTLGDSMIDNERNLQQIRFEPKRLYEKAFSGSLWIDEQTMAVQSLEMHLNKTANLNYVNDINYQEDYTLIEDSAHNTQVYMPYKLYSEVKMESGLDLIGIPVTENKKSAKFVIKNTTINEKLDLNKGAPKILLENLSNPAIARGLDKSERFWQANRPDSMTDHEKNIYKMVDSLKENNRFQRDVKLLAFAGTGYWDFGKYLRLGPYSSFISHNPIEGWRFRSGFWTLEGVSKKWNFLGYGAYGTTDQKLKGMLGIKYIWNEKHWTRTAISAGSDYDFIIDQQDELDKDNLVNSLFRKNIPFTRMFIKQAALSHDQYLSRDFSANLNISYKELNPLFDFKYRPINPQLDIPYDDVFAKKLPYAEATLRIRYAHQERTLIENYDKLQLGSFYPIVSLGYSYGFELAAAQFIFHKVDLSIEQKLRLPPKSLLYYKIETGKVFGTLPYLLLNIPAGNEYYVSSRYAFNTMIPYEFAADRFISLHSRLSLGGAIFDKIPLIRKLGWRERFSFNSYLGDMTQANIDYNKNSNFHLMNGTPFAEAGAGIENIFHVLSIEYFRRLNYLKDKYATRGGVYLGVTLAF